MRLGLSTENDSLAITPAGVSRSGAGDDVRNVGRTLSLALCAVGAVVALAGSAAPAAGAGGEGVPVYAVIGDPSNVQLSRRDPRSLSQIGPAVPLGPWHFVSGLSPDGTLLALQALNTSPASIRFLDVVRRRWRGQVVTLPRLGTGTVRWIDDHTAVVLGERPNGLRAVFVDIDRGIVRQVRVPGHLEAQYAEATRSGVVLLLRPLKFRRLGSVRVGLIRPSGKVTVVDTGGIDYGWMERGRRPTLIADTDSRRAYVLGGLDEPVAEIDLATMSVRHHALRGLQPLPDTVGSDRRGAWIAPGRIAFVGFDESKTKTLRLGLSLLDTRTWRLTRIDLDADFIAKSGDLLLGLRTDGSLSAFGLDGRRLFSVAEQVFQVGTVASNGRYVYAFNLPPGVRGSTLVVDGRAGGARSWPRADLFGSLLSPGFVLPGA